MHQANMVSSPWPSNSLNFMAAHDDRIIVGIMMALTTTIEKLPVYERDFSPKDPLINHEKTHQQ